jgi:hypothetical protein
LKNKIIEHKFYCLEPILKMCLLYEWPSTDSLVITIKKIDKFDKFCEVFVSWNYECNLLDL